MRTAEREFYCPLRTHHPRLTTHFSLADAPAGELEEHVLQRGRVDDNPRSSTPVSPQSAMSAAVGARDVGGAQFGLAVALLVMVHGGKKLQRLGRQAAIGQELQCRALEVLRDQARRGARGNDLAVVDED